MYKKQLKIEQELERGTKDSVRAEKMFDQAYQLYLLGFEDRPADRSIFSRFGLFEFDEDQGSSEHSQTGKYH